MQIKKIIDKLGVKVPSEVNISKLTAPMLNRADFAKIFCDILNVSAYANLKPKKESKLTELKYKDNLSFWQNVIKNKHYEGEHLSLKEFHLTEWIPLSPGTYFLPESERKRIRADHYFNHEKLEYLEEGKKFMVLGGVGSLRLSSKNINSKKYFFLGASSNGITHEGIPIALTEGDYGKLINKLKDVGGCLTDISGTLEVIPESVITKIRYIESIPKYYLLADKVEFIDFSEKNILKSTAAIMYPSSWYGQEYLTDGYKTNLRKAWSFCYFNPGSIESLNKAVQWLKDYAARYSEMENPPILSDFDEYCNHFSNPVEFPLKTLGSGEINLEKIRPYINYYSLDIVIGGDLIMGNGDVFKNIQNATIINKAVVTNSFNKVRKEYNEDTAKALLQIGEFIEKSGDVSAGILFNKFNEELNKPQPEKSTLKKIWGGIEKTLPTIITLSDVIVKLAPLF